MVSEQNENYSNSEMLRYYDQLEIFKSMYDEEDFKINEEEQSDTKQAGSFSIRLMPNCGNDTKGCYIFLRIYYPDVD